MTGPQDAVMVERMVGDGVAAPDPGVPAGDRGSRGPGLSRLAREAADGRRGVAFAVGAPDRRTIRTRRPVLLGRSRQERRRRRSGPEGRLAAPGSRPRG